MLKKYIAFILMVGLVLMITGCATLDNGLKNTQWQLKRINEQAIPIGYAPTLRFESEEKIAGSAGCNGYFAAYKTKGAEFSVDNISLTRKMCAPLKMQVEREFVAILKDTVKMRNACDQLVLTTGDGHKLVFDPAPVTP